MLILHLFYGNKNTFMQMSLSLQCCKHDVQQMKEDFDKKNYQLRGYCEQMKCKGLSDNSEHSCEGKLTFLALAVASTFSKENNS